ncbi:MAG: amidohydrolase family protein [Candidatus Hodarchaeales archaeon]
MNEKRSREGNNSIEPQKYFFSKMMVGPELTIKNDCSVTISRGKIVEIVPDSSAGGSSVNYQHHLALPGFINSHLHSGDSVVKDKAYGLNLNETVGHRGLKYVWLRENVEKIPGAIKNTIAELRNSGTTAALEMREGGMKGLLQAISAREQTGYDLKVFGRPEPATNGARDIIDEADGFGLNATTIYTDEQLIELSEIAKLKKKPVIVHCRRKFGETDLYRAVHLLEADYLVHANHAEEKDLKLITADGSSVKGLICCPRSNAYYGGTFPPVDWFLTNYPDRICLGTDNVMATSPSVLEELKWTALNLLQKRKIFDCRILLKMITTNPARLFNLETGVIGTNFDANFNIIDLRSHAMKFSVDFHRAVIFRSTVADCTNFYRLTAICR